jgi:hypothetical protein
MRQSLLTRDHVNNGALSLIGVLAKAGQAAVVEEFFELFKTPWEWYRSGRTYDVVVATTDKVIEPRPRLLILYSAEPMNLDGEIGLAARNREHGATLKQGNNRFPVYGDLLAFSEDGNGVQCVVTESGAAGVKVEASDSRVIRLGYDLFEEVRFLLSAGQPFEHAETPTLDIHIAMLREWILELGIFLLEIPPSPAGSDFFVCLTHDIDFVGIRNHKFDHSMWGFIFRATVGVLHRFLRRRISASQLLTSWLAVASLPFVYAGWVKDFWEPFDWYLEIEKDLPATYFLIPFKRRSGERVPGARGSHRATAYDVSDLSQWTTVLQNQGCELGVHGIDAWHSAEKGREELTRISVVTKESKIGTRIHWLLCDENTPSVLEQAGYTYDSTVGYNDTIGYRAGTSQVFRPLGTQTLLELPMHIQDGALFYPRKLNLSEGEAEQRCESLISDVRKLGGVLTVLWHDRSHAPERFWGNFYARLVLKLRSLDAWFATGTQVVGWFEKRRKVRFEPIEGEDGISGIRLRYNGEEISPPLNIRAHHACQGKELPTASFPSSKFMDTAWDGGNDEQVTQVFPRVHIATGNPICYEVAN